MNIYKKIGVLRSRYYKSSLGKEALLKIISDSEVTEKVYNSNAIENSTLTLEETDKILHQIDCDRFISIREMFEAKNLAKVIFTDEERTNCLRSKLQNKLVNLDWCFYYSKKFTTVAQNAENKDIYELFDNNLNRLLKKINPKVIFAHGKSLDNWFRSNSTDIEEILKLEHGSKTYKLFSGCLKNLSIPIIYQEWFINRGNKNTNLEQVRKLLKQYM